MKKKKFFRATIDFETKVSDGLECSELSKKDNGRVRLLVRVIIDDETLLLEIYKAIIFDLFNADYYSEEIRWELKIQDVNRLFLAASRKLNAKDAEFFEKILQENPPTYLRQTKDNVLNLIHEMLGDPVIKDVHFEDLDKKKAVIEVKQKKTA